MEARGVPGLPSADDAGINGALGLPELVYHFAFEAGSPEGLEAKRAELEAKGVAEPGRRPRVGPVALLQGPERADARMQERFELILAEAGLPAEAAPAAA